MPVTDQNFHFLCHSVQFSSYQVPTTWTSSLFLSVMLYLCQFFQIFLETLSLFKKQTNFSSIPLPREARACGRMCVCGMGRCVGCVCVCFVCIQSLLPKCVSLCGLGSLSTHIIIIYLFTFRPNGSESA